MEKNAAKDVTIGENGEKGMCTGEKQVVVIGECLVRALNFFEQHSLAVSNVSVYWENVVEAKNKKCLSAHTKDRTLDLLITNQMRYHYAIWAFGTI